MRIVSWNIRGGLGMDGRRSLDRIAHGLRKLDADIICLQEVHRRLPGGGMEDQPGRLAKSLEREVVFSSSMRFGSRYGLAILSRWQMDPSACFEIPNHRERKGRLGIRLERRICQFAVIVSPYGPFLVLNTHLSLDPTDRLESSKLLVSLTDRPYLGAICGDFNALPASPEAEVLRAAGYVDAGSAGDQPTFPFTDLSSRIDYVWTRQLKVNHAEAMLLEGSDHLPVVVDATYETT